MVNKNIDQLKNDYKVKEQFFARGFETEWTHHFDGKLNVFF